MTDAKADAPSEATAGTKGKIRLWSLPKKVAATLVAAAAAVASIGGAVTAVREAMAYVEDRREVPSDFAQTPQLGLEFWQNGEQAAMHEQIVEDESSISVELEPRPFEMHFPMPPEGEGVMICAWTDDSVFNIHRDQPLEDTQCFAPGDGIADNEYASGNLYLSTDGMNYLIGNRIRPTSDGRGKIYFAKVWEGDKGSQSLATKEGMTLHLAVVVDKNSDSTIAFDEYEFVKAQF